MMLRGLIQISWRVKAHSDSVKTQQSIQELVQTNLKTHSYFIYSFIIQQYLRNWTQESIWKKEENLNPSLSDSESENPNLVPRLLRVREFESESSRGFQNLRIIWIPGIQIPLQTWNLESESKDSNFHWKEDFEFRKTMIHTPNF